jgi:hypothetical protein
MVSRVLFGIVADRKLLSAFNLNTISYILLAVINMLMFSFRSFELQIVYGVFYGIGAGESWYRVIVAVDCKLVLYTKFEAGLNSLTTLYLCEIVGLDQVTNATGIVSLFRGVGCLVGPYAAGELIFSICS